MTHTKNADRAERPGPADWFTGTVHMRPVAEGAPHAHLRAAEVRFTAGARTNWHTHPLGQTLLVLSGEGRAQIEGEPVITFGPGDTVSFPAGVRHWHGAGPDGEMIHLALQEEVDGKTTDWQEPVRDDQYNG